MKKMKIPSEEIKLLIERVLKKHGLSKKALAEKLDKIDPSTISRWLGGGGIHKAHYDKLLEMVQEMPPDVPTETIRPLAQIPFSVTIPRESLKIMLDKNGDINIRGFIRAILDKEDK